MSTFPQRRCVSILGLIVTGSAAVFLAGNIWAACASVVASAQDPPPATGDEGQAPAPPKQAAERTDGEKALSTFPLQPRQGIMGSLVPYYRPERIALLAEPKEKLIAEPSWAAPLWWRFLS